MSRLRMVGLTGLVVGTLFHFQGSNSSSAQAAEERSVKLPNGRTFQVTLVKNSPPYFKNSKVKLVEMALIRFGATETDRAPFRWRFEFELSGASSYDITVRSPLDDTIEEHIGGEGPGLVVHEILPCTEFPALCYWVGQTGGAFVPFHFTFRNRKTGREFSFMQWYRVTPWGKAFFKAHDEIKEQ